MVERARLRDNPVSKDGWLVALFTLGNIPLLDCCRLGGCERAPGAAEGGGDMDDGGALCLGDNVGATGVTGEFVLLTSILVGGAGND